MSKLGLSTALVFLIAFIVHMIVIIPSGTNMCFKGVCGLFFWGAHSHDAIWHLAVASVSFSRLPFIMPIFSGELLAGYNFLLDFILYLSSVFKIPAFFSYFKIVPVFWFFLTTVSIYKFAKFYSKSKSYLFWLAFFVFFGGSFSYFITLIQSKSIWGSSSVQAMQSVLSLVNVQFALSIPLFFTALILLAREEGSTKSSITIAMLIFLAFGLKFYGGVILLVIASTYYLLSFVKERKIKPLFFQGFLLILAVASSIIILYKPNYTNKTGDTFRYRPLATVHSIIEDPAQLYMPKIVNARYSLESQNKFSARLIAIELGTLFLFLFINFGTRIIGIFTVLKQFSTKKLSILDISVISGILCSIILAVLLVQKGIWWNTIQFIYFGFFLSAIFASDFMASFLKKSLAPFIGILIIVLTIPNTIDALKIFTGSPAMYISNAELKALSFLSRLPNGVVFVPRYDSRHDKDSQIVSPAYSYFDNSYVPAFAKKQIYFGNVTQLQITGIDYKKREKEITNMTSDKLARLPVKYLYLPRPNKSQYSKLVGELNSSGVVYTQLFENSEVLIFKKND